MSGQPYKQVDTLSVDCPNYEKCMGFLVVLFNGSHTIIACSSHKTECRGLVRLATYRGKCQACSKNIDMKSHLISRHIDSTEWVHFKCRDTILPDVDDAEAPEVLEGPNDPMLTRKCLWCDGNVAPGDGKQCSYGDRIGFRHTKCKRAAREGAPISPFICPDYADDGQKKARRSSLSDEASHPFYDNTSAESTTNTSDSDLGQDVHPTEESQSRTSSPSAVTVAGGPKRRKTNQSSAGRA
jgi:hypothetical protein